MQGSSTAKAAYACRACEGCWGPLVASFSPMDYFHGQGDLSLLALGLARGWPLSDGGTGGFSHGARVQESDTHRVVIQPESEVKALTE